MKLTELLQAYDFGEIFPELVMMFPDAKLHRTIFKQAYDLLTTLSPVDSKKTIRYKLMPSPFGADSFFGAEDANFNTTWEVCLGKQVVREKGVDLSDLDLAANCLLNVVFIGKCPNSFASARKTLLKRK